MDAPSAFGEAVEAVRRLRPTFSSPAAQAGALRAQQAPAEGPSPSASAAPSTRDRRHDAPGGARAGSSGCSIWPRALALWKRSPRPGQPAPQRGPRSPCTSTPGGPHDYSKGRGAGTRSPTRHGQGRSGLLMTLPRIVDAKGVPGTSPKRWRPRPGRERRASSTRPASASF